MNVEKMESMWLGSDRGNFRKAPSLTWPNNPIKSFGVSFTYNKSLSQKKMTKK